MAMRLREAVVAFLAVLAACVALAGCGGSPKVSPPSAATTAVADISEYRLGPGDRLRMIVFRQEDLSGEFLLDGQGAVSLPLIGKIDAKNKTLREFETAVQDRLRDGYLSDPRVSVEMLNFRPFYILGEVFKPGEYPYLDGMTVMKAVATAQGFTYRADQRRVFIKRADENEERSYRLDSATPIMPGDTVRIPERFF
jgi:polysaccharide export outer membrane protein